MADWKKAKKSIFEDGDDDQSEEDVTLKVNEEFARRLEHNKRREELHRLQEKQKRGLLPQTKANATRPGVDDRISRREEGEGEDDEEGDVDEDEEEEEEEDLDIASDAAFVEALNKLRRKEPSIYDPSTRLFVEPESDDAGGENDAEGEGGKAQKKTQKPLYLKDLVAQQALEDWEGGQEEEEEDERAGRDRRRETVERTVGLRAYDAEQEELRAAFLEGAGKQHGGAFGLFLILWLPATTGHVSMLICGCRAALCCKP